MHNESAAAVVSGVISFATVTPLKVWGIGIFFVTLISLCAAVGIVLMPCLSKQTYNVVLTYFVGLGVGSLCGSAIFHLLPQAFDLLEEPTPEKPIVSHAYLGKCWVTVFGIFLFFLVDKLLNIGFEYRKIKKLRSHSPSNTSCLDSPNNATNGSSVHCCNNANGTWISDVHDQTGAATNGSCLSTGAKNDCAKLDVVQVALDDNGFKMDLSCGHKHEIAKKADGRPSVIATVAWMIIFGDGLHNFVDGLSIGAAFSFNILSGISISVAVLCEEFPHELGDVAILIASGMTMKQALVYNLLSAATCYVGFVIGVVVGELKEAQFYIFALAAGCFLYISLGNMISEMNKEMNRAMAISLKRASVTLILHSAGIFTGLVTMFSMAYFGQDINFA